MIKNIVFDMGNVLIRFDPECFMNRYELSEDDKKVLRNEVFRSVEWSMLDRGVIDEETAENHILQKIPAHLHSIACDLIREWDEPLLPIDGMLEILHQLKENGYHLYLLSNAAMRQHEYWQRAEASRLMDGALISADVNLLKPDLKIYRIFLEKFGLKAQECVFIDDTPINVEGAIHESMQGIVFNMDAEDLKQSLHSLGIKL